MKTPLPQTAIKKYTEGYDFGLRYLLLLLENTGIGTLRIPSDAEPSFIIDKTTGQTDRITAVYREDDGGCGLIGTEDRRYVLNEEYSEDDTHAIAGFPALIRTVAERTESLLGGFVKTVSKAQVNLVHDLREWLGRNGEVTFAAGFTLPRIGDEEILSVGQKHIVTRTAGTQAVNRRALESLTTGETLSLMRAINRHILYGTREKDK